MKFELLPHQALRVMFYPFSSSLSLIDFVTLLLI